VKDFADYWLTRFPPLYLMVEKRRSWLSWDRRVYLALVRPGDMVLDVGANVGAHTVLFSHLVGRRGRVLAFEPVPPNIERLRATLRRRRRFPNVTVLELAVGNPGKGREKVLISAPSADLTQASLAVHTAGSWQDRHDTDQYSVSITSVDAELEVTPVQRVDFLKIDVEGAELDALKGAARTISRYTPLIYCEIFDEWTRGFGYSPSDLLGFVRSLGYAEGRVIRDESVRVMKLDNLALAPDFEVSSNVLLFTGKHRRLIERFDRLFGVQAT
jgi:FkbM family methyltransferase